jgi:hypothetical protein
MEIFERILKGNDEFSTPLLCRWKIISVMIAQHHRRSFSSLKVGETSKKLCFSLKLFWVNGFWFELKRYDLLYIYIYIKDKYICLFQMI